MNRRATLPIALVCSALVLGACGRADDSTSTSANGESCSPGFGADEIVLGTSLPMSGAGAAYGVVARTMEAYFEDLNAAGGVAMGDGVTRKVTLKALDDAYDPARTVSNVRTLVENDKVAGLVAILGTSPNLAVADYVQSAGVPNLTSQTGTDEIAALHEEGNKWTIAGLPSYQFEADTLAKRALETHPNAKVAMLYQNDGFGKTMLANYERAFEGTGAEIVRAEGYDQSGGSIDSQMVNLAASGADVFLDYATGTFMTQSLKKKAEIGWNPLTILTSGSNHGATLVAPAGPGAGEGAISMTWQKEPGAAEWTNDPGMQAWTDFTNAHSNIRFNDTIAAAAYSYTQNVVAMLENTQGCTREDLLAAATSELDVQPDLYLPGIQPHATDTNPYLVSSVRMIEYKNGAWVIEDELITQED